MTIKVMMRRTNEKVHLSDLTHHQGLQILRKSVGNHSIANKNGKLYFWYALLFKSS
jgi:hypothetical protein